MLEREQYKGLTIIEDGSFVFSKDKLISSLQLLSQLLSKHYGQKVVILIDEYDVTLDKAFQNVYYKDCLLYTADIDHDEQFGFTDDEVMKLLSDYDRSERYPDVKELSLIHI